MLNWRILGNNKGSAFVIVMIILLVVSLLGMSIMSLTVSNFSMNNTEKNYMAAFYIAEAGLRHQIEHIRLKLEELYTSGDYSDAAGFSGLWKRPYRVPRQSLKTIMDLCRI